MESKYLLAAPVALLSLLLGACGGGNTGPQPAAGQHGFSMRVMPESFAPGGSAEFSMSVAESADSAVLSIVVNEAQALSHAYLEISYDSTQWTAGEAQSTGLLGEDAISLLAGNGRGLVQYGELIPGAKPAGVDGNGLLARIEFRRGAEAVRRTSTVSSARANIIRNARASLVRIDYTNTGDYDQNGEVNIADLTPLGINLGTAVTPSLNGVLPVIDGDGNGEINLADITPIGINFGRRIDGYMLYAGVEGAGYPADPNAANEAAARLLADFPLATAEGGGEFRKRFVYTHVDPQHGDRYWARAYSDGEGPAGFLTEAWQKQWHETTVASYPASEQLTAPRLEIVDGRPALAWSAGPGLARVLYYARAGDSTGLDWPSAQAVPGSYTDAWQPELGVIGGLPAISVPLDASETCMYTRSSTVDGDGSWSPMVKSSVSQELQFEIFEIDGRPLVFGHNSGSELYFYFGDSADATAFTELGWSVNLQVGCLLQQGNDILAFYRDADDGQAYFRRYGWDGNDFPPDPAQQLGMGSDIIRPGSMLEYGGKITAMAAYGAGNMLQQYESTDLTGDSWALPLDTSVSQAGQFAPVLAAAYGGLMAAWTDVNGMQVASAFSADGSAGDWQATAAVLQQLPVTERKELKLLGPHPCMALVEQQATEQQVNFYVYY